MKAASVVVLFLLASFFAAVFLSACDRNAGPANPAPNAPAAGREGKTVFDPGRSKLVGQVLDTVVQENKLKDGPDTQEKRAALAALQARRMALYKEAVK